MGYGWLNAGSLVLGVAAWVFPLLRAKWRTAWPHIVSLSCCGGALLLQQFYQSHLVDIEDWSALLDTARASVAVSAFLLVTTILLNVFFAALDGRKKWKS